MLTKALGSFTFWEDREKGSREEKGIWRKEESKFWDKILRVKREKSFRNG